jgi:hypothetical protein
MVVFRYEIIVDVLQALSATFVHIPLVPSAEYLSLHASLSIKHQGYSIIIFLSTTALSQQQPVYAETSYDNCGAQDDNKRNLLYLQ